jgi:F-type H+-transporting ATPase subunit gamma
VAAVREFDKKLVSLRNTLKLTSTMKLVSASKFRRAQELQRGAHEYAERLNELISDLAGAVGVFAHPLLTPPAATQRVEVLLFTSDRGLCGSFNNAMIRATNAWLATYRQAHPGVEIGLSFAGRRGFLSLRNRVTVVEHFEGVTRRPEPAAAVRMADTVIARFRAGKADEVYLANNVYESRFVQTPTFRKLLPIAPGEFTRSAPPARREWLFEPDRAETLARLVPRSVAFKVFYALIENAAGEHGARMAAMEQASTNTERLIEYYQLLRSRVRQAGITRELIEIVASAETVARS